MNISRSLGCFLFFLAVLFASNPATPQGAAPGKSPRTPEQAQKEFRIAPGLRIELVASEPRIESPVAAAFDEDGRLWVVEMRDYPNGPAKGESPLGRIKLLEDKDGDGRYETATVFAEGLLFANGIMPWRGGVFVTAAPHILHLKDTTGTGKADKREVWFEGFATENPQLRVSHPVLGIDNWVYVANGLRGGKIRSPRPDGLIVDISGRDFRFDPTPNRPSGSGYEATAGMGQYGNTFDDWGRRFVCTNRNHIVPIVLENRYVKRNLALVPPEPMRDNQGPGGAAKVFPLSSNFTTASAHAGTFTSACSVTIYRGQLLPEMYRGAAFTCEPAGNLVHMETLVPDGAGFRGEAPFEKDKKEFLASPDDWFRPVNLFGGPDGALYVVDMYRAVIEHPQFMPPELKNRPDLRLGADRGRIWRIVPESYQHKPIRPQLSKATTDDLVQLLGHPDAWWRMTAHRLLLERHDPALVQQLKRADGVRLEPAIKGGIIGQVHLSWLMERWYLLTPERVHQLTLSDIPQVRETAVRLAERLLPESELLQNRIRELANDRDPRVRFQVALTIGEWFGERPMKSLARIAWAGVADRWTRAAVASSIPDTGAGPFIELLLTGQPKLTENPSSARFVLLHELSVLAGTRGDRSEIASLLDALGKLTVKDAGAYQIAVMNGLAEGMGRRGVQFGEFLRGLPALPRPTVQRASQFLADAATVAADAKRETSERVSAVRLLAHADWAVARPVLFRLTQEEVVQEVRLASVRALAAHRQQKEIPALLMKSWTSYTPAVRREVLEAMTREHAWIIVLLDELEAKRVKPGDIDTLRTRQLVNHPVAAIRERAKKLLHDNLPGDRKEVLEKYKAALKLKPDAPNGKAVFQKNCATCHHIAGVGIEVGPNIADTLGKTPDALLVDILIPNAAIDNNYINYTVTTKSGKVLTGIIAQETASSITLRRAENQTDVLLRQDIDEMQSTGVSLMPDGLEKNITLQEMADLLAFLKNWRFLDNPPPKPEKP